VEENIREEKELRREDKRREKNKGMLVFFIERKKI